MGKMTEEVPETCCQEKTCCQARCESGFATSLTTQTSLFTKGRDASNAARFKIRSRLKNPKALHNLGAFASSLDLFTDSECDSDWDNYEKRCLIEKANDEITQESHSKQQRPKDALRGLQEERIVSKGLEAVEALPELQMKINPIEVANVSDPASIDYRDPQDYLRTPLIKATIDRDLRKMKYLIEKQGANPFICDREGATAFAVSLDYGFLDIANYLQDWMDKHPLSEIVRNAQTA